MKTYPLTWGESITVRQRFIEVFGSPFILGDKQLEECSYVPFVGDAELIELTKKVIKRQTGREYDHILLTNGATGAINVALRAYRQQGYMAAVTRPGPYFSLYPSMIKHSGLEHSTDQGERDPYVRLIDSPSNPLGEVLSTLENWTVPTIWDSVYHTNCYTPGGLAVPCHEVAVGSYSKLTGLNGIRVGWVATNDPILYERQKALVASEYCGICKISCDLLKHLLVGKDDLWCEFETIARYTLD